MSDKICTDYDGCNNQATRKVSFSLRSKIGTERHVHYVCSNCEITEESFPLKAFNIKVEALT